MSSVRVTRPTPGYGKVVGTRLYFARELMPDWASGPVEHAEQLAGWPPGRCTVVQLAKTGPPAIARVSLMAYPGLISEPFPALEMSVAVNLTGSKRVTRRQYLGNPPILHRKELLLPDHPNAKTWRANTSLCVRWGLFDDPVIIGHRTQWERLLLQSGLKITSDGRVTLALKSADSGQS